MRIEEFGPFQLARDIEAKRQRTRRLARALSQALSIHPGLCLTVLLGVPGASSTQEALESWVAAALHDCEGTDERVLLGDLARKFEKIMADATNL